VIVAIGIKNQELWPATRVANLNEEERRDRRVSQQGQWPQSCRDSCVGENFFPSKLHHLSDHLAAVAVLPA